MFLNNGDGCIKSMNIPKITELTVQFKKVNFTVVTLYFNTTVI